MGGEETGGTVSWVEEGLCLGTVTVSTCLCGNYVARSLLFSLLFYKNSSNVDLIWNFLIRWKLNKACLEYEFECSRQLFCIPVFSPSPFLTFLLSSRFSPLLPFFSFNSPPLFSFPLSTFVSYSSFFFLSPSSILSFTLPSGFFFITYSGYCFRTLFKWQSFFLILIFILQLFSSRFSHLFFSSNTYFKVSDYLFAGLFALLDCGNLKNRSHVNYLSSQDCHRMFNMQQILQACSGDEGNRHIF